MVLCNTIKIHNNFIFIYTYRPTFALTSLIYYKNTTNKVSVTSPPDSTTEAQLPAAIFLLLVVCTTPGGLFYSIGKFRKLFYEIKKTGCAKFQKNSEISHTLFLYRHRKNKEIHNNKVT